MTPPTFKVTTSDAIDLGSTSEQCFSGIVGILRRLVVCRLQLTWFDHWRLLGSKQTNTLEPMFAVMNALFAAGRPVTGRNARPRVDPTPRRPESSRVSSSTSTAPVGHVRPVLCTLTLYSLHVPHCTCVLYVRAKSRHHKITELCMSSCLRIIARV